MTTIEMLKDRPIGNRSGGYEVVVKTAKKKWQGKDKWWIQQAVIQDTTGEMMAEFFIKDNIPIKSGSKHWVIVGIIQELVTEIGPNKKKLYIEQFKTATQTADEFEEEMQLLADKEKHIVRSKVKCLLACSWVRHYGGAEWDRDTKDYLEDIADWILK